MGLTQKYREEAQSIADEIYNKYGIECSICESTNEANLTDEEINIIESVIKERK